MLEKFDRFNRRLARVFQWVGIAGLMVIMLITCADVIGTKTIRFPVPASTEVVSFAQITAISFAAAITLLGGMMVRVDFFVNKFPRTLKALTRAIISMLVIGLFILLIWRTFVLGQSYYATNQVSSSARIPLYIFAFGVSLASVPIVLIMARDFLVAVLEIGRKPAAVETKE